MPSNAQLAIRSETPIVTTPRVTQLLALFDIPPAERSVVEWEPHLKLDERPWSIGAIVGPSGAGKSTLARHLFGDALVEGYDWPQDRAIVDAFPSRCGIKDITALLLCCGRHGLGDGGAGEDDVVLVQHDGLARRDRPPRLREHHAQAGAPGRNASNMMNCLQRASE